jgi:predicted MPP superfamily phosphohydrolase
MPRRTFIKASAVGLAASSLVVAAFGADSFQRQLRTQFYRIPSPYGLRGKRLLVLADIHYGPFFGEGETKILSAKATALCPDLVFFAGDLANEPTTDLTGFFVNWNSPGIHFFAPGNHDVPLDRRAPQTVLAQLVHSKIQVLNNEKLSFGDYNIIGMESGLCGNPDLTLLNSKYSLVISHEPDLWDYYPGPMLQLAGHTHGGQVQVQGQPLFLPALGRKYPQGIFSESSSRKLIVSRGIGTSGLNIRLGCAPEIVVVDFI